MAKIPLIALFPVACPHCARGYQLELDVMKLARLKRVAVCGQCGERFSVSVRIKRGGAEPVDAVPAPAPRGRNGGDHIPDAAAVLAAMKTDPDVQRPLFEGDARGQASAGAQEAPERSIRDIQRMATVPDQHVDVRTRDSAGEDEPGQGRQQEPRRSGSVPPQRTLEGVGAPPGKRKSGIDTHIIVEVDSLGDGASKPKKRQRSLYRPEHLVTKPGLGIPFALRAAGSDDVTNAIEESPG